MKTIITILYILTVAMPLWAMNAQVTSEGISLMIEAGIDETVIHYLIIHQTCAIGPKDVIKMKAAGLNANEIISAIESDRCYKPEEATVYDEIAIIERLKQAGLSDEAILQYLDRIKPKRRVDPDGRAVDQYGNTPGRPPYPVEGSRLPESPSVPEGDILIYEPR